MVTKETHFFNECMEKTYIENEPHKWNICSLLYFEFYAHFMWRIIEYIHEMSWKL